MSVAVTTLMSPEEFLVWIQTQEQRHELVDGVPMAMAGAKQRHDRIVVNTLRELGTQLRGAPCRPFSSDNAVRIASGNIRFPDAGVDCGRFEDDSVAATAPRVVIEVLSPSTRHFDLFGKLEDYKTVTSLAHIVLVDPDAPRVIHWMRGSDGAWGYRDAKGPGAAVVFPDVSVTLRLADLYEGLTFQPRPSVIVEGGAPQP